MKYIHVPTGLLYDEPHLSKLDINDFKLVDKEPHYNHQPIEVIDMMLSIYGKEAVIHFCLLNSFKYRMRAGHKDDAVRDIEKALWYEKKAKELETFKTKEI
jgi:hypothetical protein